MTQGAGSSTHGTEQVPPGPGTHRVTSPILTGTGIDPVLRRKLVWTNPDGRDAVLVELVVTRGMSAPLATSGFLTRFAELFQQANQDPPPVPEPVGSHYVRCALRPEELNTLVRDDLARPRTDRLIYRAWPDYIVRPHIDHSVTTINADAAARTYRCSGDDVVWAVIDSGIDATHPHFQGYHTLDDPAVAALHRDFTAPFQTSNLTAAAAVAAPAASQATDPSSGSTPVVVVAVPVHDYTMVTDPAIAPGAALQDTEGHGSHIAGTIAGCVPTDPKIAVRIASQDFTASAAPGEAELPQWIPRELKTGTALSGVAPMARLVSLKVLGPDSISLTSVVIEALDYVRQVNAGGRDLRIHGVNLSLGCDWPRYEYAAGQSPMCRELDLLVGTGVVAVVSAGNSGETPMGPDGLHAGQLCSITDPGNAASAITVGSTHRDSPHTFGITHDSSKGPTADGRRKPDLVAPGERITSVAAVDSHAGVDVLGAVAGGATADYIEMSGTSMSAAHVSGAVAALLSARRELIGHPETVKQLICSTATDLDRHEFFQGAGLLNLMRALSTI